jgi:hypothetical protein
MQTFTIYPKEGESFTAEIYKLEPAATGEAFALYDDSDTLTSEGYLSFENIAAVIPEGLKEQQGDVCFLVYLKNRKEPFKVYAHAFDPDEPFLVFKRQSKDALRVSYQEWRIDGLFFALSEVIAVLPADGLLSYRR